LRHKIVPILVRGRCCHLGVWSRGLPKQWFLPVFAQAAKVIDPNRRRRRVDAKEGER